MSNGSEHSRQPQERYDLDVLLQQAIKSRAHSSRPSEEVPHTEGDDVNSHRRGPLGRAWARLRWEWEFGPWRRWWMQLLSHRETEAQQPHWAVAQALIALTLPGALIYFFLAWQLDVPQIVMAMQIGLSILIGKGW